MEGVADPGDCRGSSRIENFPHDAADALVERGAPAALRAKLDQLHLVRTPRDRTRKDQHASLLQIRRAAAEIQRCVNEIADSGRHSAGSADQRADVCLDIEARGIGGDPDGLLALDPGGAADRHVDHQRRLEHQIHDFGVGGTILRRDRILLRESGKGGGSGKHQCCACGQEGKSKHGCQHLRDLAAST